MYFLRKYVHTATMLLYIIFLLSPEAQLKPSETLPEVEEKEADKVEDKSATKVPAKDVEVETPELKVQKSPNF